MTDDNEDDDDDDDDDFSSGDEYCILEAEKDDQVIRELSKFNVLLLNLRNF